MGELIVSDIDRHGVKSIAFFEKNGLQHNEFELKDMIYPMEVKDVMWNCYCSILAVWLTATNGRHIIRFYISKNYKWSLKYEICSKHNRKFANFKWDCNNPKIFYVLDSGKYLMILCFRKYT